MSHLPTGTIVMWYGAVGAIPGGFVLCDGNNGTPNLTDKFVIGAGGALNPGDTGGAVDHSHTVSTTAHSHALGGGTGLASGGGVNDFTEDEAPPGSTNTVSNMPPYHALVYMMKD